MDFPPGFSRTIIELFGETGITWLNNLPSLIADCERRWSLTVLPPFPLSYNYVAPAVRADGVEVVLKLGVPNPELLTEIAALRIYDGRGIVRLLDADPERGILLLERLNPGTPLSSLEDDGQATHIAAQVMQQLWRPISPGHSFPTVAKWAAGFQRMRTHFGGGSGPLPSILVERAERLQTELLASSAEAVLLHGDLHHDNILMAERTDGVGNSRYWLALDPKGVVGEPAYEVGPLFFNPQPKIFQCPNPRQILARRVDQLAEELSIDRERVLGWGLVRTVLSAWWDIEDHGHGWEPVIALAEHLAALSD